MAVVYLILKWNTVLICSLKDIWFLDFSCLLIIKKISKTLDLMILGDTSLIHNSDFLAALQPQENIYPYLS